MTGAAEAPPARYLALALQAATASLPATADHAEGVAALIEKRPAVFTGE